LRSVIVAAGITSVVIYLQLVAGALMRHDQAGLAIPDLPLAYGHLLPPTSDAGLAHANEIRKWEWHLPEVTLWQVWIHFTHRMGALLVTSAVSVVIFLVLRRFRHRPKLARLAWALLALLVAQFTLGVLTVYLEKPADIASLHVACGALLLMTAFVMMMRAIRLQWIARQPKTTGDILSAGAPRDGAVAMVS
jgi:cytochrome c oxidase assembly protein subunit 15